MRRLRFDPRHGLLVLGLLGAGCAVSCLHGVRPAGTSTPIPGGAAAMARPGNACAAAYAAAPSAISATSPGGTIADVLVADMDGDGNTDVVVARGNDNSQGNIQVLFGPFDGGAPASWTSDAAANYRRLAVADVDHDGRLDIAAAVQTPSGGSAPPTAHTHQRHTTQKHSTNTVPKHPWNTVYGCDGGSLGASYPALGGTLVEQDGGSAGAAVAVFRNHGDAAPRDFGGSPSQSFVYQGGTGQTVGALSVDFGDYDGDGYADLAVGGGDPEHSLTVPVNVLANDGHGRLGAASSWHSSDQVVGYSVRFADLNGDGMVDLFVTTEAPPWGLAFYGRHAGAAASVADASTPDSTLKNGCGCTSVVATDGIPGPHGTVVVGAPNAKDQICGGSYENILALLRTPSGAWALDGGGLQGANLAAAARLADVDGDQRVDLILATWFPLEHPDCGAGGGEPYTAGPLYAVCDVLGASSTAQLGNDAGPFFIAQGLSLGDIDNASPDASSTFAPCDGGTSSGFAVSIPDSRLTTVTGVTRGGRPLQPSQYLAVPGGRLVYIAGGYSCASPPTVSYKYSTSLDLVVADQASSKAYVFFHE